MDSIISIANKTTKKIQELYKRVVDYIIIEIFKKEVSILFLGIDNAGKTTLINKLKSGTTALSEPTHHPVKNTLSIGKMTANVIDLGGHTQARLIWKEYFYNCDGVVFIVDVNDSKRFETVKSAYKMVRSLKSRKGRAKVPISVLMNKIDLANHNSLSAERDIEFCEILRRETGIDNEDESTGQPVKVTYVSITNENGSNLSGPLGQSFVWLERMIFRRPTKGEL
ncbi:small COPII coat GTPase SAR1-like [Nylanderia fulva]|uniref:small COPII coat GTPase SAR1-like n=1 Tax=Nylanderia fulva TaxID=613905 RepID=UPI0010FB3DD7|nr:small COPII coat GTPase SAR1-like [Nylanderia fulva]